MFPSIDSWLCIFCYMSCDILLMFKIQTTYIDPPSVEVSLSSRLHTVPKKLSILQHQDQLVMTSVVSISKGQPCISYPLREYIVPEKFFFTYTLRSPRNCKTHAKTSVWMRLVRIQRWTLATQPKFAESHFRQASYYQWTYQLWWQFQPRGCPAMQQQPVTVHSMSAYIKCQLQCYLWLCIYVNIQTLL